jgi:hypothetical protein
MEDMAKVIVDIPEGIKRGVDEEDIDTGGLEKILECPYVKEPVQEIR